MKNLLIELLAVCEKQLDQSVTDQGLKNVDLLARVRAEIDRINKEENTIEFTRVNSDSSGNPRYACMYFTFLGQNEKFGLGLAEQYSLALSRARQFGGRKFNNKQYGGGIVFAGNPKILSVKIREFMSTIKD